MPVETITTTGQVKTYERTEEGIKVKLKDVLFPDSARGPLDLWMDGQIEVRVTIETFQDALPMKDEGQMLTEE